MDGGDALTSERGDAQRVVRRASGQAVAAAAAFVT